MTAIGRRLLTATIATLFLTACPPVDTTPPPPADAQSPARTQWPAGVVGQITDIDGTSAFITTAGGTRAARPGDYLFANDHFFTGAATRMIIVLAGGGALELDADTDPTIVDRMKCLVISLFRSGRMFVDAHNVCVEAAGATFIDHSQVVYQIVAPAGFVRVTVIGGEVQLGDSPGMTIKPGYRLDFSRTTGRRGPYEQSRAEVLAAVGWTNYYRRFRPALPGTTSRPGENIVPGPIGAPPQFTAPQSAASAAGAPRSPAAAAPRSSSTGAPTVARRAMTPAAGTTTGHGAGAPRAGATMARGTTAPATGATAARAGTTPATRSPAAAARRRRPPAAATPVPPTVIL